MPLILPDLTTMPEIDRLRWLVDHMADTPITELARRGLRWECPVCTGTGKKGTGRVEQRRLQPGQVGYLPDHPFCDYDPSQWYTAATTETCPLCKGVGRLNHEPMRVSIEA